MTKVVEDNNNPKITSMFTHKEYHSLIMLIKEVLSFEVAVDVSLSNFFKIHKSYHHTKKAIIANTVYALLRNYYKLVIFVQIITDHIANNNTNQTITINLSADNRAIILSHSIKKQYTTNLNINYLIHIIWLKILNLDYLVDKHKVSYYNLIKQFDFNANALFASIDQNTLTTEESLLLKRICQTELPAFILTLLLQSYSESTVYKIAESMQHRAPFTIRVNIVKSNLKNVSEELKPYILKTSKLSPYSLELLADSQINKTTSFINGHIEVQDESSQLSCLLLNPKRSEMVVDFCAGSGGKALMIGMLMRNSGRIYAFDINERRLDNLNPRLKRSGLTNVYPQLIVNESDLKIQKLYNKIDKVFVDAPCSGIGTIRRNPDLKFKYTEHSIKEFAQKQLSILSQASKLLKINSYIVYATCSIFALENELIIKQFLDMHTNFIIIDAKDVLLKVCKEYINTDVLEMVYNDCLDNKIKDIRKKSLTLLPHIHNTDGFFAILLQKIA